MSLNEHVFFHYAGRIWILVEVVAALFVPEGPVSLLKFAVYEAGLLFLHPDQRRHIDHGRAKSVNGTIDSFAFSWPTFLVALAWAKAFISRSHLVQIDFSL